MENDAAVGRSRPDLETRRHGYKTQTYSMCSAPELNFREHATTCGCGITVATVAKTGSAEVICIVYDSM